MNPDVPSGVKLTYDDFLLFPDDGQRHELIDGEHYVTPSAARANLPRLTSEAAPQTSQHVQLWLRVASR